MDCSSKPDGTYAGTQVSGKMYVKYETSPSGISSPPHQFETRINNKPPTMNVYIRRKGCTKGNQNPVNSNRINNWSLLVWRTEFKEEW